MKQVANGNVLIGGGWPGEAAPETGHPRVRRQSLAGSAWVAQHVVPRVAGLRLLRAWAAFIFNPEDGIPICSEVPGQPGHYLAISNSYGFTLGPILGRLISELVTGRAASYDLNLLRLARFA
jgi:glycine/D-amino acid oxidase-like deaminating enzyme